MPKFLEKNAGLNATEIISSLCAEHPSGNTKVVLNMHQEIPKFALTKICLYVATLWCVLAATESRLPAQPLFAVSLTLRWLPLPPSASKVSVKVGIPEFLNGIGNGVESHVTKLKSEIGDFQKLLVIRALRLKKLGVPCKHRKLILKYTHKYRLGL
ncbi:hypothetical protein C1H46_033700 [Malus baccata]|uniref:Small ribosomal subunit protein mS41 SAM domain-containing protein n=1 Tax=Malus baccata TaxID=106549 RepID=A0A540L2P2_MALBA|nr:hypothetical protein C1H46_033700 [Malus baccata]